MSSVLMAKLGVDASGMDEGLAKGKRKAEKAAKEMADISAKGAGGGGMGAMGGMLGKLGGLAAGVFAVDKIKDFVVGLTDMAGALMDMSDNLGVPVEQLQQMQGYFGEAGVSSEKFGKAMGALNSKIEEAKGGNESTIADFEALGVTMDDLRNLSPDELIMKMADATKEMASSGEKAAKLEAIFGKAGKSMVGAMSGGSDAIKETGAAMTVLTEENAKALDQMADDTARFWGSFKAGSANALGVFARSWKHTMGELGLGKKAASPFETKQVPKAAEVAAEKAAKAKAEQERLFNQELQKFQKDREKQAEQTRLDHHEKRMAAEEELAKRQEDAEKKNLGFRNKQADEVRQIVHMLGQAAKIGGDVGGEIAAKAGLAKEQMIDEQAARLMMTPQERVAADREARKLRHAREKAQRMVEAKVREGRIQDAGPAMLPVPPEVKMGMAVDKFGGFVNALVNFKLAIKNQP